MPRPPRCQILCRRAPLRAILAAVLGLSTACGGAMAERPDRDRGLTDAPAEAEVELEPLRGDLAAGVRDLREGDLDAAGEALQRHLKQEPRSALAHYHLGLVALARQDSEPARRHFEQALALEPKLHGAASNLGVLYLQAGEDVAALRVLEQAAETAPQDARVLANLAAARLRRGLWSQAVQTYQQAAQLAPGHGTILYDYAVALLERFEYERALKVLDEALLYRPRFALARAARVACLQGLGQLDAALVYARESLDEAAEPAADNHLVLARVLVAQGKIDDALEALERAVEVEPEHANAQLALGELYDAAGRKADAIAMYARFLKNPSRTGGDARRIRERHKQLSAAR